MPAASRVWGPLCPVDGGLLIQLKGTNRLYCPNQGHDSPTGRSPAFFDRGAVKEGYTLSKTPGEGTGLSQKQLDAMKAEANADTASDKAAEAAVNKPARVRAAKEPKDCECGCGGQTKGGRYLPGHDAKHHSRLAAEKAAAEAASAK